MNLLPGPHTSEPAKLQQQQIKEKTKPKQAEALVLMDFSWSVYFQHMCLLYLQSHFKHILIVQQQPHHAWRPDWESN